MPIKSKKTKTKKKSVAVTRKFLTNLANRIYNPADRSFLRLCDGSLQNGPDPTNYDRPMHCGLGELYYAMTGRQPEETGVDEEDVVNLAVELSPIAGQRQKADAAEIAKFDVATAAVKKLTLPETLRDQLIADIEFAADELEKDIEEDNRDDVEHYFRVTLDSIPNVNDDGCADGSCSLVQYRKRSQRVAAKLREAAKLLP